MKKIIMLLLLLIMVFTITACNKPADTDTTPVDLPQDDETEVEPEPKPVYLNPLTGLPISKEISEQRPVSLMINNVKAALPHYGISDADIYYEALAEGGITRIMAVFQDYASIEKVGWIRSARDYYLDFAQNHNAIFGHWGGSPQAYDAIGDRDIDDLDGMSLSVAFFRDKERKKTYALEHTAYTTGKGLVAGIEKKKIDTKADPNMKRMLQFNAEEVSPGTTQVDSISLPYSSYLEAVFDYDSISKTYKRSEFGKPHIDSKNNQQIAVTNVLVIFTDCYDLENDAKGRLGMKTVGEGEGCYISSGSKIDIKWSKESHGAPMELKTTAGEQLKVNPGKSFIVIFPNDRKDKIEITAAIAASEEDKD